MSTNDDAPQPPDPSKIEPVAPSQSPRLPGRRGLSTHAQRQAKLKRVGLVMLLMMASALLLVGALGSIKWENALTTAMYPSPEHQYALAALNVSSGLIFWIALIGVYLPARWGLKLNLIGCAWFMAGTMLLEVMESGKVVWTESIADVVFWSAFPTIQIVCILAGTSRNPAFVGEAESPGAGDA